MRRNILYLVKNGFSREEVYFMPAGEVLDYIKIIEGDKKEEADRIAAEKAKEASENLSSNDTHMAGNTVPGLF